MSVLQLRPPSLVNPKTMLVPDAGGSLKLYGPGQDWIVVMPPGAAPRSVNIDGMDEARHVVVIGGAVQPAPWGDFATGMLLDGTDWIVYTKVGFTGATGGTFRARTSDSGAYTAPIAWDATPAMIKTAIEAVLGAGSVAAVDGPATPGGPWKIAALDDRLGRVTIDASGLTGSPVLTRTPKYNSKGFGMALKRWKGTMHIEGVFVGGPDCTEACNVLNPNDNAILQLANDHFRAESYRYHKDHHHPDAMQAYLGPCEMRTENCDFISKGSQAMIAQPRETATPRKLEGLRDWWHKNTLFQALPNYRRSTPSTPGSPYYMEDDYPGNNSNLAGWQMRAENTFFSRIGTDNAETTAVELSYFNHYGHSLAQTLIGGTGVTLRAQPPNGYFCDPVRDKCGVGYVSPGYGGAVVDQGIKRLQGETKLT